jgi:hypothetical protein
LFPNRKPEEIFTPKGESVNTEMFVKRQALESSLKKALRKNKHIIIHGDSGCGKTWLYKKVLADESIPFEVLNAATVNLAGSISNAINFAIANIAEISEVGYEETKKAKISAVIAEGELEHTGIYEFNNEEPFLKLLKQIFKKHKKNSFLIIDNIEHIIKDELLIKELTGLLLYLDDSNYAKYGVKLILVGTPNNIRDYFSKSIENQTIINRVQEIPEVSKLTQAQVDNLIYRGFFEKLSYTIRENDSFDMPLFNKIVYEFIDGIPQYIHEVCLEIAINSEELDYIIDAEITKNSIDNWVQESLISECERVSANINSISTKLGRRNQIIYTMSRMFTTEFTIPEIEDKVRNFFPKCTSEKTINISGILSELVNSEHPIIKKSSHGRALRFLSPKIRIACRAILSKGEQENIIIKRIF